MTTPHDLPRDLPDGHSADRADGVSGRPANDLPRTPSLVDELGIDAIAGTAATDDAEIGVNGAGDADELARHLASCRSAAEEIEALTHADTLLRAGYGELAQQTPTIDDSRLEGILRELRDTRELGLRRHARRSVRMILWVTFLLLSVLGTYAFVKLALKALD